MYKSVTNCSFNDNIFLFLLVLTLYLILTLTYDYLFSIYIYSVIYFILEGAAVMYPFSPSVIDRVFLILIADFTLLSIL